MQHAGVEFLVSSSVAFLVEKASVVNFVWFAASMDWFMMMKLSESPSRHREVTMLTDSTVTVPYGIFLSLREVVVRFTCRLVLFQ